MSRLWEIVTRKPPLVAPDDLVERGDLVFGFTAESELAGWTVTAYGAGGRQLGRPLKGLSEAAQATLIRQVAATDASALPQLADAWSDLCRHSSTNADVLTGFADAAARTRAHDTDG